MAHKELVSQDDLRWRLNEELDQLLKVAMGAYWKPGQCAFDSSPHRLRAVLRDGRNWSAPIGVLGDAAGPRLTHQLAVKAVAEVARLYNLK